MGLSDAIVGASNYGKTFGIMLPGRTAMAILSMIPATGNGSIDML